MLTKLNQPITCALLIFLWNLKKNKQLRPLDYYFSAYLYQQEHDPLLALMSALVSFETSQGHTCIQITQFMDYPKPHQKTFFQVSEKTHQQLLKRIVIPQNQWILHLSALRTIGNGHHITPLVLHQHNLYLHRFFQYETALVNWIQSQDAFSPDIQICQPIIHRLFPPTSQNKIDWQKIAATLAAFNSFAVISGGPGTGKTTTIIRLMALMIEYALKSNRKTFDIALAAPTGKAASRLTEAIQTAYHQLPCDEKVKDMIPKKVMTLHHLLGANPEKSTYRYHQNNLLPVDTLIIDEASMIDMTLMSHLILALDSKTQLILLGDHHQLASVEAGNLLGDLCCFAKQIYSKEHTDRLVTLTGEQTLRQEKIAFGSKLNNHFAMLTKSYRFDHGSAIGQLAQLICNGSHEKLTNLLQQKKTNVAFYDQKTVQTDTLDQLIISGYRPYLEAIQQQADPETIHTLFQQYQVLCAIHDSPFGVQQLNQYIMTVLHKNKLIADIHSNWFIGKPIMITQNYPPLSLYNGDLGITMLDHQGHIRIAFINAQRQIRFILPTRLPEYDIAFAITIHKSQGSEFNQVTIILPDQLNLVMTRELLYTAVTRAKSQLHILGCQSILKDMIKRKTNRYSGLVQRLSTS